VFLGVSKGWNRDAGTFRVKDVSARPLLVIEVTSPTTRAYDLDDKVILYHKAGVPFYAVVDFHPELEARHVYLLGFRSTPEGYVRADLNERGWLWLEGVRLWLAPEGDRVVCYDEQGHRSPDVLQLDQAARQAGTRAEEAEREARQARKEAPDLATRLADLVAELKRLRGPP
jgi:hypothetical protein